MGWETKVERENGIDWKNSEILRRLINIFYFLALYCNDVFPTADVHKLIRKLLFLNQPHLSFIFKL